MTWLKASEDDDAILAEINSQTDRAAALIAAAYLEERLLGALKARLTRNQEAENALFGRGRPLSSFSSRIDLGLVIGVYGEVPRRLLHTIREVRNEFAHQAQPRDFNFQRIKDLSRNLECKFHFTLHNTETDKTYDFKIDPDGTPRGAFMSAIKYLLILLDMETKMLPLREPVAPIFPNPTDALPSTF